MSKMDMMASTGRSGLVLEGTFLGYSQTRKSFRMFVEEPTVTELQVPIRSILHWELQKPVGEFLTIYDLERGDDITIIIPKWLGKKERIV